MSQPSNAHWRPAPEAESWVRRCLIGIGCIVLAIILWQWLAAYLFLWSLHIQPKGATPLTIVRYAHYYGHLLSIRHRIWVCSGISALMVLAAASLPILPQQRSLHGDARFACLREIRQAHLFSDRGLILGRLGRRYLILPGQQSILLAAPPRSGKDVGIVIPNALSWPDSLVITDIKREVWNLTAGYRASQGQKVYLLDLLSEDGRTAHWNCLSYVSSQPERRINDIQRIADILYADVPGTDPFWIVSARSLFLGIALYLFETPSLPKTIGEIRRQGMASDDEGFGQHWRRIIQGRQSGRYPLGAECVRALYDVIDLAPVTASSVRKTFTSRLDLWANPLLDEATSSDDFDLRELRRKPISIYVGVNPDDLNRLRPILSLFFNQTLGLQTHGLPEHDPTLKYQLTLILNEFTALGAIPIIVHSAPFMPGYNVRMLLVIQAPSQLRDTYGVHAAETMMKSVAVRIVFAPKEFSDAKEVSDDLGFATIKVKSHSRPSAFSLESKRSRSTNVNISDHARALLLAQEVKEIGVKTALIFMENVRPIRCSKIRYFADRNFRKRLMPPPALPARRCVRQSSEPGLEALYEAPPLGDGLVPDESVTREVTPMDVANLDQLSLEDVPDSVKDFHACYAGDRPTESELEADVQRFLETMRL